jgi:hypothetical protein
MLWRIGPFVLLLGLVWQGGTRADTYDFDVSEFEKKPYSINGSLELRPSLSGLRRESAAYTTRYGLAGGPAWLDNYPGRLELAADYRTPPVLWYAAWLGWINYDRDAAAFEHDAYLYEAYGKTAFGGQSVNVWLGKKTFKWGKGYVFNPTAFAARPKDVNDVEAGQEGYWSLSAEFIRSLQGRVSTLALHTALVPVYDRMNQGFLNSDGLAGAAQLYLLAYDTDLDLCVYADDNGWVKAGLGFSRNIIPNLEVHGEGAYHSPRRSSFITADHTLATVNDPAFKAVLGGRYLTTENTTIIAEYIRNGEGFSAEQMDAYYSALQNPGALAPVVRSFLAQHPEQYNRQYATRNYLYAKASHPEPFKVLYFTPAVYGLVNADDGSVLIAAEGAYARYKNIILGGKLTMLNGDARSEYGGKIKRYQLEVRAKYSF